ncbi:4-oxalomesaconate tautomerase [Ottowia thiooxydans]|uniref:4-oxalomesaconate tautomerase n=1 Tax=Ottowia thiooxydans TaxID=219182 RepID=A0ABV2QB23_9BURK
MTSQTALFRHPVSRESDQYKVRCVLMRGGTSKGPFFLDEDLPPPGAERDLLLLRVMGALEPRRIDGIGGIDSLTNKVAIISRSSREGVDVDYLFGQICVHKNTIDYSVNCGNMLSAVGPFAVDSGLVQPGEDITRVRIFNVNTGKRIDEQVVTLNGKASYQGDARIDGVHGSAAPVLVEFLDVEGSKTGALLPTGRAIDIVDGVRISCVDAAVPMAIVLASDLGISGHESAEALNANTVLCARVEELRCKAGALMGLGDVSRLEMPKLTLVAAPRQGGVITGRYFMPYTCHTSFAVTGAVCLGAACLIPGTVTNDLLRDVGGAPSGGDLSIEHPAGLIHVKVKMRSGSAGQLHVASAALVRTARRLFAGEVYLPVEALSELSSSATSLLTSPKDLPCSAETY